jgi:two-component system NtrC family sensor kinase
LALRDYDLRMSNVRVHLDLCSELPTTSADPHQLQQVFLNLVNNAVDAILERSADGDLWVNSGVHEGQLFVEFTDSGPGVHDASRVFNPFYTTKPVGKGTGLGLSICYGIITEHGGTIRVKNMPPRGASFRIELPLQPTPVSPDVSSAPVSREARILLVSQNASILKELGATLLERGHSVFEAGSDVDARSRLSAEIFDAIVVDAQLGGGIKEKGSLNNWIAEKIPEMASRLIVMPNSEKSPPVTEEPNEGPQTPQRPFNAVDVLALVESTLEHVYAAVNR